MYRLQRNPRNAIVPIAGDRAYARLVNAVSSNFVLLVFAGTLTIATAAADAIRNRGSIMAAFSEVGIDENGTDRHVYDGRVLRFLSEMAAPSALSATRVTSVNVAAYPLEEAVRIYFAHPFAAIPRETAYREKNTQSLLQVFAKLTDATGLTQGQRLAKVTAGTATLSAVTITVTHGYDRNEANRPEYIPTVRQEVLNVDAASAQLPLILKGSNAIRQLVITQETVSGGEVSDIINSLTLIADDDVAFIGPAKMTWRDLALDSEFEFGGAVVSSNRAHLGMNFQQFGRLASVIGPQQLNNLSLVFDCQPSVLVGGGASKIRVTVVELRAEAGIVNPERTIPV